MSYSAAGQLAQRGWHSLWITAPLGILFSAWMWTDRHTAELIARASAGTRPLAGYLVLGEERTGYSWHEFLTTGRLHSWIYTNAKGVAAINSALTMVSVQTCQLSRSSCTLVSSPQGVLIA